MSDDVLFLLQIIKIYERIIYLNPIERCCNRRIHAFKCNKNHSAMMKLNVFIIAE